MKYSEQKNKIVGTGALIVFFLIVVSLSPPSVASQVISENISINETFTTSNISVSNHTDDESVLGVPAQIRDTQGVRAREAKFRPQGAPEGLYLRGSTNYLFSSVMVEEKTGPLAGTKANILDLRSKTGKHTIEIGIVGSKIQKIRLENVDLGADIDLGLEDLTQEIHIEGRRGVDGYAIDPTRVSFENGTLTKVATGNRLWKCELWNFSTQICEGDWVMTHHFSPGETYDVLFNATDPAYIETFDAEVAGDIGIVALGNSTLVITFIDTGTNHSSFEIWATNGVQLVDETDIDATVDLVSRIAVDAINGTHFSIGVVDGPEDDLDFYIYDRSGNQVQGQTQIDSNIGLNTDVGVCQLGNRFVVVNANDNDDDADFELWGNDGVNIVAETAIDGTITPSATLQNLVDCAAINSTFWGYAFYDDADNDATFGVRDQAGTQIVANTDLDLDVGETGQIDVAGMRNSRFAIVFYDSTDDDITITVRQNTGTSLTSILGNTDIDTDAGADSRVAIAEVENNGASNFVVAWLDTNDTTIKAGVYNNSGSQVRAPFNITTSPSTTNPLLDVAGYNSNLGFGLCNGTFAIAYSNASGIAVFETYYVNGTRWNGICGDPDTTPPHISHITPANATLNDTSNFIDFTFNVTDGSPITNCTLNIDDVPQESIFSVARDTPQNISIFLSNGEYEWSITCSDAQGNTNTSIPWTISVDVPIIITGADIRLAALDNTTLVVAYIDATNNDASFEVWHTNGTALVGETDLDTAVDSDSRIAIDIINTTHFVIGVLDGPEDDFDFYIYDRDGNQMVGQTQIDAAAGLNTDVGICQMGNRFVAVWADNSDNDANYEIWGNDGVQIVNEGAVDTTITPGATLQNLVDCPAINSTVWGYAFYDDADNDATFAVRDQTGAQVVANVDLDLDVGETGQISATGLRSSRFAIVFYDSTDDDITLTIQSVSGTSLNSILANTDIDTDAGTDSRVGIAEIDNNGASNFVVTWQDTSDSSLKAAVYNISGSQVTATFNISRVPSATQLLHDVIGYNSNLGIGLCNGTFAVAYTNSSGNSLFETYHLNGSRWNGRCGEPPVVDDLQMPSTVVLNAGTTRSFQCNISASDPDGGATLVTATSILYSSESAYWQSDNPVDHYTNSSCTASGTFGTLRNFTCSFNLQYFARNGTWTCLGRVYDSTGQTASLEEAFAIDPLYALNITNTSIDFGNMEAGTISTNRTENLTNVGNMNINISVLGYGSVLGDGNAFDCGSENISVETIRFSVNESHTYAQKTPLSATYQNLGFVLQSATVVDATPSNTSYWQVQVPKNVSIIGQCNGTVVFHAIPG